MINSTLGEPVSFLAGGLYLFIHYTLLCAYISEGGRILDSTFSLEANTGATLFTLCLGCVLLYGSTEFNDRLSDISLAAVITSFLALVAIGFTSFDIDQALKVQNFSQVGSAIPIM